jgi:hypothetical protein
MIDVGLYGAFEGWWHVADNPDVAVKIVGIRCHMGSDKLVAEAGDISGTLRKRNAHYWKTLKGNG